MEALEKARRRAELDTQSNLKVTTEKAGDGRD